MIIIHNNNDMIMDINIIHDRQVRLFFTVENECLSKVKCQVYYRF